MADQPLDLTAYRALKDGGTRLIGFVLLTVGVCVFAGAWSFHTGVYAVMGTILVAVVVFAILWRVSMPEAPFPAWIRLWHDRNVRGYTLYAHVRPDRTLHQEVRYAHGGAYIAQPEPDTVVLKIPLGGRGNSCKAYWVTDGGWGYTSNIFDVFVDAKESERMAEPMILILDVEGRSHLFKIPDALDFLQLFMTRLGVIVEGNGPLTLRWREVDPILVRYTAQALTQPIAAST